MSKAVNYVGIDVGSKELVVALKPSAFDKVDINTFENNTSGHKKLLKLITKYKRHAKVCMEATGVYHFELALLLAKCKSVKVMVVNPKAMHHFATSMLQRAKTDRYDAQMILEYLMRMNFLEWKAPEKDAVSLQRTSRRIAQLKKTLSQEQARLSASEYQGVDAKVIRKSISGVISMLKKQINTLEQHCLTLISSNKKMSEHMKILVSFVGIADVSAIQIMAELVMMPDGLTADQWVACAGLDPRPLESGVSVDKPRRISKRGNKYIRAALYMPALVAIKHDQNIHAYYENLLSRGKKKMQAIIAVMRKLLMCIWGALHNKENWNGEKFYKIPNQG